MMIMEFPEEPTPENTKPDRIQTVPTAQIDHGQSTDHPKIKIAEPIQGHQIPTEVPVQ